MGLEKNETKETKRTELVSGDSVPMRNRTWTRISPFNLVYKTIVTVTFLKEVINLLSDKVDK